MTRRHKGFRTDSAQRNRSRRKYRSGFSLPVHNRTGVMRRTCLPERVDDRGRKHFYLLVRRPVRHLTRSLLQKQQCSRLFVSGYISVVSGKYGN
jgi:hypothetical protein